MPGCPGPHLAVRTVNPMFQACGTEVLIRIPNRQACCRGRLPSRSNDSRITLKTCPPLIVYLVERYRRPDLAHLNIDISIEDPGTFTKPWQLHMVWTLAPGEEIGEAICENNKYIENTRPK